ncbi:PBSX family phage terminase large subunit [Ruminococcus sp. OA3]|uniref:PBSX family phage terminase large subunit n=1 Tax=Ruminococcus sp. OA3 TaxID=2914164 RepID=UPI001F06BE4A|nr:PBSX family phage terminase large subunit [Ruminococcus sp. OA3]MCH1984176.1 PBSX family phage terminase large subunit [Ruminococcus sp. OA3]
MPKKQKKPAKFKFLPFSDQQKRLMHWWRPGLRSAENDFITADGAIRSGKTIACIIGFLTWSQEMFSGESFILAGKTMGALKKNVIRPMLQILEAWGWPYTYIRSGTDARVEIGTNAYYLYGANTEAAQDALQGLTAAGAYLDEAALFPQSFVDQAIGRCSVSGAKIWMNCNPEGPHHYIREEFLLKVKEKRVYHLHFMMTDNLSLSPKVIERYKRAWVHGSVFYKRFILGLWVAADGLIYQQFADHVQDYLVGPDWLKDNQIMYAVIGVDFGGTKSAHSFTLTGFTKGFKQVVVLDEYYRKKRINPKQLQDDFIDFVRRARMKYKVYEAYCDSAEQSLIAGLESACIQAHVAIDIKNAIKGPINDRIAFYNSLIAQGRWKVMKHCTHTIEAFEQAVYDDKKPHQDVRLDDGLMNVDSLDSTEYSTESIQDEILYIVA